jgi:transcription initiation factor TFIID subunit 2
MPEPHTPISSHTPEPRPEFMPVVVHIDFSLRSIVDGIQFVLPTDSESYPYVSNYYVCDEEVLIFSSVYRMHIQHHRLLMLRDAWVPCVDMWQKCTWEFEFVVPRYLEEPDPVHRGENGDFEESQESILTVVICSGDHFACLVTKLCSIRRFHSCVRR